MSVINHSIPKGQENKIQSMKLKMPGMERDREDRRSADVCFSPVATP